MTHLSDEQIENLVANPHREDRHLGECAECRNRLAGARAIRRRLKGAFDGVHADSLLQQQVVAALQRAEDARPDAPVPPDEASAAHRLRPVLRRIGPALVAAAALVLLTVALTAYFSGPNRALAASAELAQIHQANLMPHATLHGSSDPAKVAEYLKDELGFVPAMPKLGAGMDLRGCCVAHFRNRPVGSYVVRTDRGVISIIVLRGEPRELAFADRVQRSGHTYHLGAFARCRMAAAEINGYTYAAVGEVNVQWLTELLERLLNSAQN